ncbi:MAG TPA: acyltransferase [Acidimicrobiia bacterium]|nr:acyltransferase [Acidimicrobiia bacterium]
MTPTASPASGLAPPVSLPSSPQRPAGTARPRLHGIDGLRAFAALWVVLFHIRAFSGAQLTGVPGLDLFIRSGSTGVSLFLVLSGFCLYLPYAGGRLSRFSSGRFFARRCRRLLPAYYATLAVILLVYALASGHAGLAHMSAAGLAGQAAAHLTLVHQLLPSTFYGLNGAYWSLGLEWELYLTLPLLVLGVRRIGLGRTVALVVGLNVAYRLVLAVAAGHCLVGPHTTLATVVLPNLFLGRWGEFGLGMLAAELYVSGRAGLWGRRLIVPAVLAVPASFLIAGNPLAHLLFGVIFFTVVCLVADGGNPVARAFSSTPLVVLGAMSYSIYLVHQPLVEVGAHLLGAGNGASPRRVFLELVALIPVLLVAAWILFVTVERRTVGASSLGGLRGERLLFPTLPSLRPRPRPPSGPGPGQSRHQTDEPPAPEAVALEGRPVS